MFPRNEDRNEGTFACSPGTKTGTSVHSPKPLLRNRPFVNPRLLSLRQNGQTSLFKEVTGFSRVGHAPSAAGTFRKKFRKNSGKTPETLSELFLEFPSRVRLGSPKSCNSRHLEAPEHFQNYLPPSTAGDAFFFRSGSGEGLLELVMEFPAALGVFLKGTRVARFCLCLVKC